MREKEKNTQKSVGLKTEFGLEQFRDRQMRVKNGLESLMKDMIDTPTERKKGGGELEAARSM